MAAHRTPLEVRFRDTDRLGHVNNAVYLTYFEQGRVSFFDRLLGLEVKWNEEGLILANAQLDFLAPILLEDKIAVDIRVTRLGNKSFELGYSIVRLGSDETEMARGSSTLVCFDYIANTSIMIPASWRTALERFAGQ